MSDRQLRYETRAAQPARGLEHPNRTGESEVASTAAALPVSPELHALRAALRGLAEQQQGIVERLAELERLAPRWWQATDRLGELERTALGAVEALARLDGEVLGLRSELQATRAELERLRGETEPARVFVSRMRNLFVLRARRWLARTLRSRES